MGTPSRRTVLFIITKSSWGGAQRYVYDLATSLPKDAFETAVALGSTGENAPGELQKRLQEAGVPALLLPGLERDLSVRADLRGFFSLCQTIRAHRPDIVHLNSSKAGVLGALAARLNGTPRIIFTAHGWPFEEKRNFAWRAVAYLGSSVTALLSHFVIVVSKRDFAVGKRMPFVRRKMHLIHNGIALPLELGSGAVIRSAFPASAHIIGTIGELTKNKNQIALIEEARLDPSLHIAIVGEGEERPRLEKKIKEYGLESRVKLFGFLPAADVLRGFDAFALPSLKEGLPYVLIEAKTAGLPIVLTNRIGGIPDILDATDLSDFALDRMVQETAALY